MKRRTSGYDRSEMSDDMRMRMPTRIKERILHLDPRRAHRVENAHPRFKRGLVADFLTYKVLSAIDPDTCHAPMREVDLFVGKWHEDGQYWSGMLHKFILDLLIGGPKEGGDWKSDDKRGFNDAWVDLDANYDLRTGSFIAEMINDHLGVDREFFRKYLFWGLQTCGIMPSDVSIQSQVLSQWEAESGSS